MKIHKLQVTKEHINKATPCESQKCPIAYALWDYFGTRYSKIEVCSAVYLYKRNGRDYVYFYPTLEMTNFIRDFDAGKKVHPIIFRIDRELVEESE